MSYFQARRFALPLLAAAALLGSCVDNAYDLADVDTDGITVGDQLTMPLGSGSIVAGDLLNIGEDSDISVDEAGNYIISYPGTIDLGVPQNVRLADFDLQDISVPLGGLSLSGIPLPAGQSVELARQELDIEFNKTDQIIRIDSIRFDTDNGQSLFSIGLQLAGMGVTEGDADVVVKATFPEGYVFQSSTTDGLAIDGNQVTISAPLSQLAGSGRTTRLQIARAVVRGADKVGYEISLVPKGPGVKLSVNAGASIRLSSGLKSPAYKYIYGEFKDQYDMQPVDISTSGLDDIFEGNDNVLSFYDTHVRFETESNIGIPLDIDLNLSATDDGTGQREEASADPIRLAAPALGGEKKSNRLWLGSRRETAEAENYTFVNCSRIGNLIRLIPDRLRLEATIAAAAAASAGDIRFFPDAPYAKINYAAEIPLAPARDFQANTSQMMKDAFDKDLIDYIFTGGSVEILGDITNSLPVNFEMNLMILDEEGNPVGIQFPAQQIKGCKSIMKGSVVSPVSFSIGKNDMDKMATARNLKITLKASCDETLEGGCLRPDQQVKLDLRIKRTGGIVINK